MASTPKSYHKEIGPCSDNGEQVKDMNIDGITRIVKISVHHGVVIDGFRVSFRRNGCEDTTELWCGHGGDLQEVDFHATEYITAVKGYYGNFNGMFLVRSLKFETNLRTLGPYGKKVGIPFELPAITGQIIGFHARSGQLLDAIGVYVKANNTATGGSNNGGNTGGSTGTGTGTGGSWTQSDTNFWDRPVNN